MQTTTKMVLPVVLAAYGASAAKVAMLATANPLGKVLDLMAELSAKVTAEGVAEGVAYKEYLEWCDDTSKTTQFEIKTATSQKEKLQASIVELASDIDVADSKIEELSESISANEQELKAATTMRKKEAATFKIGEEELASGVDTLGRAVGILEKESAKNPASLAQLTANNNFAGVVAALGTVMDAASFSVSDRSKLLGLIQSKQQDTDEDDSDIGAPEASAYKSHGSGIVDVLNDMKSKAEVELGELRKSESTAKNNFQKLSASLRAELANDNKDLDSTKVRKAAAQEGKATSESDLGVTVADLKSGQHALEAANTNCMQVANDHGETVKAREEELKVIAKATQILKDSSNGGAASLLQLKASSHSRQDLARSEVVTDIKKLARAHHSAALAQLASRIAAEARFGAKVGDDPFAKIRGMIQDMVEKLQKEGNEEADEKAYCDEEMSKAGSKKDELDTDVAKLTGKIDQDLARSTELKDQVKEFEAEVGALIKQQAEMDEIRRTEHAVYVKSKAELQQGLDGVRKALEVLRDYYAKDDDSAALLQTEDEQPAAPTKHEASGGAASSIIGILEVCESDLADGLAKEEMQESTYAAAYEKTTQENKVEKATKEQDIKYKTQEFKKLDNSISERSSDRETTNTELSAVNEYFGKLKERCVAKPESYEEKTRRREAEIAGLKEALSTLSNEAALVQRGLRGSRSRPTLLGPDEQ